MYTCICIHIYVYTFVHISYVSVYLFRAHTHIHTGTQNIYVHAVYSSSINFRGVLIYCYGVATRCMLDQTAIANEPCFCRAP